MRKVKWGVLGTAFICERSTFPGMLSADNCEMFAIAGRNMEKAEDFQKNMDLQRHMEVMKNCWQTRRWRQYISHCQTPCIMSGP